MTNHETETVTTLQAQVSAMAKHLHRAGLLPPEAPSRRTLTAEEHKAISDEINDLKTARLAVVEDLQARIDAAQDRWQAARLLVNEAHNEAEALRAEITRGHEAHLEALGDLTRKLAGGR